MDGERPSVVQRLEELYDLAKDSGNLQLMFKSLELIEKIQFKNSKLCIGSLDDMSDEQLKDLIKCIESSMQKR